MYDFILVGQGLAGSLLAWRLIQRGQRVLVLDDGHQSAASKVAAGLINPLAGMRFNHHPQVHQWLEAAEQLYGELERAAGHPLLHWQTMVRLFRSPEQRRFYERRAAVTEDHDLLAGTFAPEASGEPVHAPHGGFYQRRTGHLDLPALLHFLGRWLRDRQALQNHHLDPRAVQPGPEAVRVGPHRAARLIFCEGYRGQENPWFGRLPFSPDKGEFLRLEAVGEAVPRRIVNGAHWLLPHADGSYRFGATHDHRHLDTRPTAAGREQLLAGLQALLRQPEHLRLADHQAGVRPATADRRPFLGAHPRQPRLLLFNGFGAHGSLAIPWYSARMADWLLDGHPLPTDADLGRFANLLQPPAEEVPSTP